jgi:hypothetical protein
MLFYAQENSHGFTIFRDNYFLFTVCGEFQQACEFGASLSDRKIPHIHKYVHEVFPKQRLVVAGAALVLRNAF